MSAKTTAMLKQGAKAPAFTLEGCHGHKVRLSELKGRNVVLYFYPKDNTPGCTVEAEAFRDAISSFEAVDAVVLGISPDSVESHCKFTKKLNLNFILLSDKGHKICEKYRAWVEKNRFGKTYHGVQRATFLIDRTGKIAHIWPKVKPQGHAREVLEKLEAL